MIFSNSQESDHRVVYLTNVGYFLSKNVIVFLKSVRELNDFNFDVNKTHQHNRNNFETTAAITTTITTVKLSRRNNY